jgi:hypothetical protein
MKSTWAGDSQKGKNHKTISSSSGRSQEGKASFKSICSGGQSSEFKFNLQHLAEGKLLYPCKPHSSFQNGSDYNIYFIAWLWRLNVMMQVKCQMWYMTHSKYKL